MRYVLALLAVDEAELERTDSDFAQEVGWLTHSGIHLQDAIDITEPITVHVDTDGRMIEKAQLSPEQVIERISSDEGICLYIPSAESSLFPFQKELLASAEERVKSLMQHDSTGHDWLHVDRVRRMALHLHAKEGVSANASIIELAALLHDIGDAKFHGGVDSSEPILRTWLSEWDASDELIEHIITIVGQVSYKGGFSDGEPLSLEAKIVQDADRLDALGAIGIARAFAYGGAKGRKIYDPAVQQKSFSSVDEYRNHVGTTVNHFYEKLFRLPERLHTESARAIAKHKILLMQIFINELYAEAGIEPPCGDV